jgi:hypothetical protein
VTRLCSPNQVNCMVEWVNIGLSHRVHLLSLALILNTTPYCTRLYRCLNIFRLRIRINIYGIIKLRVHH